MEPEGFTYNHDDRSPTPTLDEPSLYERDLVTPTLDEHLEESGLDDQVQSDATLPSFNISSTGPVPVHSLLSVPSKEKNHSPELVAGGDDTDHVNALDDAVRILTSQMVSSEAVTLDKSDDKVLENQDNVTNNINRTHEPLMDSSGERIRFDENDDQGVENQDNVTNNINRTHEPLMDSSGERIRFDEDDNKGLENQDNVTNDINRTHEPLMDSSGETIRFDESDDKRLENRDTVPSNQNTQLNNPSIPAEPAEVMTDSLNDIQTGQSLESVEEQTVEAISPQNQSNSNCSIVDKTSSSHIEGASDTITKDSQSIQDIQSDDKDTEESAVTGDDKLTTSSDCDFKCTKCSFVSSNETSYKSHVCQISSTSDTCNEKQISITYDEPNFFCNECEFKAKGHAFEEHLMCHLSVKPYQCIYCSEAFVNRRQMGQHVAAAHAGKKMNCALKALSKAKRLMVEAQKTNSFIFLAKISGKVPLQYDPHEPKVCKDKQDLEESSNVDSTSTYNSSLAANAEADHLLSSDKSRTKDISVEEMDSSKVPVDKVDSSSSNTESSVEAETKTVQEDDKNQILECNEAAKKDFSKEVINTSLEVKDVCNDSTNISLATNNKLVADDNKMFDVIDTEDVEKCDSVNTDSGEVTTAGESCEKSNVKPDLDTKMVTDGVTDENKERDSVAIDHGIDACTSDDVTDAPETCEEIKITTGDEELLSVSMDADKEDSNIASLVEKGLVNDIEKSINELDSYNKLETVSSGNKLTLGNDGVNNYVTQEDSKHNLETTDFNKDISSGNTETNKEHNVDSKVTLDDSGSEVTNIPFGEQDTLMETDSYEELRNVVVDVDKQKVEDAEEAVNASEDVHMVDVQEKRFTYCFNTVEHKEKCDIFDNSKKYVSGSEISQEPKDKMEINEAQSQNDQSTSEIVEMLDVQEKHVIDSYSQEECEILDNSKTDISGLEMSQEAKDEMDTSYTASVSSVNRESNKTLATVSDSSELLVENKTSKSEKSNEQQELKIVDSFSLDMDDNSFPSDSIDKMNREKEAVIVDDDDEPNEAGQNNLNTHLNVDDAKLTTTNSEDDSEIINLLPEKPHDDKTNISTENLDNHVSNKETILKSVLQSSDEIKVLPLSTEINSAVQSLKPTPISSQEQTPPPSDTRHMRNPNFYICGLGCSFSSLNSVEFRDHLLLEHAGESSFPCYYCGFLAHSEESLLKHMMNHAHTYNKAAPLYYCGISRCKFGTNLLADYLNHMQIMHDGCTAYKCKECDHVADNVKDLVKHFDENFLHVVNCPHCSCKGSDRRLILRHITQYHPGKAKMVQVAKQIICKERKQNNFYQSKRQYVSSEGSESLPLGLSQIKIEKSPDICEITNEVEIPVKKIETVPKTKVKKGDNMEKHIEPPTCDHCTFVARDTRRLLSHKNCHGHPQIKRHRFRCIYCPQGFDASAKFKSHIACHPGLIKYWIYCCRRCEFDTNQRHVILKHIKTKDDLHMHSGEDEDMFSVVERIMESRVLECEHCNYQTRHKLHLQIHYQREHKVVKAAAQSSTDRDTTPPGHSSPVTSSSPGTSQVRQYKKQSRNISLTSSGGQVQENRLKKFKCPHCQYLVPKAADLKLHVKRHDYLGKISLNIFRCKYCSSSSTARDIVFEHIREKHSGKPLQLVRKTVNIDTSGTDNTFSETSVAEAPISSSDYNPHIPAINPVMPISSSNPMIERFHCETCSFSTPSREVFDNHLQLHNTKGGMQGMARLDEESDDEESSFVDVECKMSPSSSDNQVETEVPDEVEKILQVIIVPDCVATDTLTAPARCPQCYFASGYRSAFVSHVKSLHPLVMVVMRNNNTVQEVSESGTIGKPFYLPEDLSPEVLVIPEKQVFSQAVGCPKCPNFATYFRRNLVLHIQKHHSEVTAMGYSSWGGWLKEDATGVNKSSSDSTGPSSKSLQDESCIVGSGNLDEKIGMLYENFGAKQKCLICTLEKSKKYFMHIHILRHLDICLWKCAYCPYRGLEKHKIKQHIKEHHPDRPTTVSYVNIDIDSKVSEFIKQLGLNRTAQTFHSNPEKEPPSEPPAPSSSKPPTVSPGCKYKMAGPLGTPELDEKIRCLYETVNNKSRCILCSCEFTRKFAIHRHIITNHLKIALIGCGYCDFTGVDKHYITDHTLMQHPNAPIKVITLEMDIPQKVTELLSSPNPGKPVSISDSSSYTKGQTPRPAVDSTPKAYFLGKDLLDQKLQCLYRKQPDGFKCKVCDWKFPRKYACHRHIFLKHLKINLFGCAYCHAKAVERYLIISHIKEAHPGSPPHAQVLKVDIDKKISEFLSGMSQVAETLSNIKQTMDSHPAPDEEFLPEEKPDLSQVKLTDLKPGASDSGMVVALFGRKRKDSDFVFPAVLSPVSPKKLKTTCRMTDVTTNIKVICVAEGSLKKYVCEVCRFTSLHRSNVYRHVLRVHEKYREQECEYCGYKTLSVVLMKQHIDIEHEADGSPRDHSEETSVMMSVKQEPTEDLGPQEPEMESSEMPASPPSPKQSIPLQHTVKTYCCAYCDYETQTSESILKHTKELHFQGTEANTASTSSTSSTAVSSDSADKPYSRPVLKTNVKKGMFSANQYLNCGYCSYRSASLPEIKNHAKFEHRAETALIVSPYAWKYICKICSLKNSAAGKMKNHINRHIEYRPYTCGSCGTSYSSSDELRKHIKNYQHADEILYIKNDKKEKKVNQLMAESRRCAEMVNLGTPFKFDNGNSLSSLKHEKGKYGGEKQKTMKRMYNKPQKKITSTWKTEALGNGVKFKFSKKKPTAHKTKFRYAQNCPFTKKVAVRVKTTKDTKLTKKDCFSCCSCSFKTSVSVDEVKKHHEQAHQGATFMWRDSRLKVTCVETGGIVECSSRMKMPPIDEQFTHKQLSGKSTKFYCNRCEFSCWVLQAMKSHLRMHQPRRFLCPYCHMRYHKRDNSEKHLSSAHPSQPSWVVHVQETEQTMYTDNADEEEEEEETLEEVPLAQILHPVKVKKKKLKSKLLGPKTKRNQRLIAQYEEWTSEGRPARRTSQTVFYCCHQCSFTSESLYLFRLHLATHGNFIHLVSDLTSESPLKCGYCPYVAGDQSDFSLHMETHFDMRNYRCGHCSYSAYTKAHVRSHIVNFHTGLEEQIIDTSSLALVDNLTEATTNMPKLVNLDPQVLLEDVMYLTDQQLAKLMAVQSGKPKFDFAIRPVSQDLKAASAQSVDDHSLNMDTTVQGFSVEQAEGFEWNLKKFESDYENISPLEGPGSVDCEESMEIGDLEVKASPVDAFAASSDEIPSGIAKSPSCFEDSDGRGDAGQEADSCKISVTHHGRSSGNVDTSQGCDSQDSVLSEETHGTAGSEQDADGHKIMETLESQIFLFEKEHQESDVEDCSQSEGDVCESETEHCTQSLESPSQDDVSNDEEESGNRNMVDHELTHGDDLNELTHKTNVVNSNQLLTQTNVVNSNELLTQTNVVNSNELFAQTSVLHSNESAIETNVLHGNELAQETNVLDSNELLTQTNVLHGNASTQETNLLRDNIAQLIQTNVLGDNADEDADVVDDDIDRTTQEESVDGDDADELDGFCASPVNIKSKNEPDKPESSTSEDPGNVFNTLNSWLSSA